MFCQQRGYLESIVPHTLRNGGSALLFWMRFSLRRSLHRIRSSARLYQALAARELDEASRESYLLLADHQRRRAARKVASLFNLHARLPEDNDSLAARVWRRLLILCGPNAAVSWIEWRDAREMTLIIAVARAISWLADLRL